MKPLPANDNPRRLRTAGEARISFVFLLLLALFPLALFQLLPIPTVRAFEWAVYDAQMRLRNEIDPRSIGDDIRLVGVGDTDDRLLDDGVASRSAYISLLQNLRRWQARSVAFDIFFIDEKANDDLMAAALDAGAMDTIIAYHFVTQKDALQPSREIPADLAPMRDLLSPNASLPDTADGVRQLHEYLVGLRDHARASLAAGPTDDRRDLLNQLAWVRHLRDRLLQQWFVLSQGAALLPSSLAQPFEAPALRLLSPPIMLAPDALGFVNVEKGEEDVVRSIPLVYTMDGRVFPQLSLTMALRHYGVDFSSATIEWGRAIRFTPARNGTGEVRIPIDARGMYLVNFREGESFLRRQPTIAPLVQETFRPQGFPDPATTFRDKFVFIGEVIAGGLATDVEPIPLQTRFPMVGVHANVLDNILRGDFLWRMPQWGQVALVALLALLVSIAFHRLRFIAATLAMLLVILCYIVAQFILFQRLGLVMPVVKPVLGTVTGGLLLFGYLVVVKDRDRRLVRDVFLKSVSPRIGEEILKNYQDDAIWGARREISVLFIDVRGYTTLSEEMPPEDLLSLLDEFYDTASEAVFRNDGQVNKFMGDAVLALFGALPEEPANHAERAVRAAVAIQRAMAAKSAVTSGGATARLRTGAGVMTGEATVGLVGRRRIRIEYTALGDTVNTASRLQGAAGEGEVVLGEKTVESLGGLQAACFAELGLGVAAREEISLKGKRKPLAAFRLTVISASAETIRMEPS